MNILEQTEISPEQLALKCQAGCSDSFEKIVSIFEIRIFNFLMKLTRNEHDAQDLTQETFIDAYKYLHRYDSKWAFSTWIFTIAKRRAYSHFRKIKTQTSIENDPQVERTTPAHVLEQKEHSDNFWDIAKQLKPKQYEALWLRYGEGFSTAEIARIMKITVIHVKVLLHRARNGLIKYSKKLSEI